MNVIHFKRFNQMRNFWTKTRLLSISCIIFICYMIYGQYRINHMHEQSYQRYKLSNIPIVDQRQLRYERLLDQFTTQPANVEISLPTRQGTIPRDAVWQTVDMEKEKFFIYSAYLDTRMASVGPVIRIIAAAKTHFPRSVWCRLWYSNSSKTVSAFTYTINDYRNFTYAASFVLCKLPLDGNIENHPLSVSVVSHIQDPITNEIVIQIPNGNYGFKTDMGVCVQPFHSHYDQETRLMEFVELYYILGVRHFTFYNYSVSPKMQCVLDRYKDDDLISVLPWNLDMISDVEIKTEGINAALNDCLYRYMYTSKYIAIVDIDEMIIPRRNVTLVQLIKQLDALFIEIPEAYSYSFRNAFFCMEWSDDELSPFNQNRTETNIVVLRKTYRKGYIQPHASRSKYICDPRGVVEAGNHCAVEFIRRDINATVIVPTEIALLHHYRLCNGLPLCSHQQTNCTESIVVDRSLYKYRNELVERITNTRNRLNESCVLT